MALRALGPGLFMVSCIYICYYLQGLRPEGVFSICACSARVILKIVNRTRTCEWVKYPSENGDHLIKRVSPNFWSIVLVTCQLGASQELRSFCGYLSLWFEYR